MVSFIPLISLLTLYLTAVNAFGQDTCKSWKHSTLNLAHGKAEIEAAGYRSKKELNKIMPSELGQAENGIYQYRLTYWTQLPDGFRKVSGLINVPDTCRLEYPLIAIQHGTITANDSAPSQSLSTGISESALGFVTVAADYIGYGESGRTLHPYHIEKYYGPVIADAIQASLAFAGKAGVSFEKFFLKGYSEGGYATLAAQRYIESHHSSLTDKLTASAPSAGAYDMLATGFSLLKESQTQPVNLLFVMFSYAYYYPGKISLTSTIPKNIIIRRNMFYGDYDYEFLTEILPHKTDLLVLPEFRKDYLSEARRYMNGGAPPKSQVSKLLLANSIGFGWKVKTLTRFYHCIDDKDVPIIGSKIAYKNLGKDNPLVSLEAIESSGQTPYTHYNCPARFTPVLWFKSLL